MVYNRPLSVYNFAMRRIALILAGGDGLRLWPISSRTHPKQLDQTFFVVPLVAQTYARACQFFPSEDIFILTRVDLATEIGFVLGLPTSQIIALPLKTDTASAILVAAAVLAALAPGASCITLCSDHLITDDALWGAVIQRALEAAEAAPQLSMVGTPAQSPASHYGYILPGMPVSSSLPEVYSVARFVEKPDEDKAKALIAEGALWNTGMYAWQIETLLALATELMPERAADLRHVGQALVSGRLSQVEAWLQGGREGSFDTVITERTQRRVVVPSQHTWTDIGNWETLYSVSRKDAGGNVFVTPTAARVIPLEAENNLVITQASQVVLVGVQNVVVVDGPEGLLVMSRSSAGRLKEAVEQLSPSGTTDIS